jgi:hypothetical protein
MARRAELLVALLAGACGTTPPASVIPRTTGPIKIDGEWDEPDWSKHALRGQFIGSDGALSRPTSEVRLLTDGRDLFVGLYAADDDIRSTDAFELRVANLDLRADAAGHVTPALPGLRIAVDRDGTLDNPSNFDEEWVVELAIPLTSLMPGDRVAIEASRCDTPKHGAERCASWHGTPALEAR